MWDLPGPGLEPVSPALAGGFLTTAPPGKPPLIYLVIYQLLILFCFIKRTYLESLVVLCYFSFSKYAYVFHSFETKMVPELTQMLQCHPCPPATANPLIFPSGFSS